MKNAEIVINPLFQLFSHAASSYDKATKQHKKHPNFGFNMRAITNNMTTNELHEAVLEFAKHFNSIQTSSNL